MSSLPPPPPGYGYPPQYGGAPMEHPRAGTIFALGIVSLVLGAIGVFCCAFLGLIGLAPLLMSGSAIREIEASGGALTGLDKVRNGRIMGIIAICLTAVGLILNITLLATGVIDVNRFETTNY
ncbi:hypothetical protein [Nocardioides jiangxiensis]|uniref:DUF4190 domain-containing protein n=1 Tax=Nocardioides jiangxiensis TaxID=3064524 RepID=A0ABT9B4R2_9ACTN|nr:hypothetical protein [Nocardioides sp. WY-20]MDO7869385.1 hypothetical protein [Nocardioides sp. WY-20]